MTFDVTAKDMTATTCVKCHVRITGIKPEVVKWGDDRYDRSLCPGLQPGPPSQTPGGLGQRFWSVSAVTWPPKLELRRWRSSGPSSLMRVWNMWNHNTMLKDIQEGRSTMPFMSTDSKCYKRWKGGIKTIHFVQLKKIGLEIQDLSTVKNSGRNSTFFQRTAKVEIPQLKVIIKLTKRKNKGKYIHLHTDNIFLISENLASAFFWSSGCCFQSQFITLISFFSPKGFFSGIMVRNSPVLHSRHDQPWPVRASASGWGSIASTSVPSSSTSPLSHIGTRWSRKRKHLCVSQSICRIDFSQRNISHFIL